jgi:hypothetical protein
MGDGDREELLAAALAYASRGWRVLHLHYPTGGGCSCPKGRGCDRPGKHPIAHDWTALATTDPDRIRGWWRSRPWNVGIATGPGSGLWVLDLDTPRAGEEDGLEALVALEEQHGAAGGVSAFTGGGGQHVFFAWPEDGTVPNGVRVLKRDGVKASADTRGAGGLIVAPPSRHASGEVYVWEALPLPERLPPAPRWLVEMVAPAPAPPRLTRSLPDLPAPTAGGDRREAAYLARMLEGALERVAGARDGDRHAALIREARTLGGHAARAGWSPEALVARLVEAAVAAGKDHREAERTARWAVEEGLAAPLELRLPDRPEWEPRPARASSGPAREDVPPWELEGELEPDPRPLAGQHGAAGGVIEGPDPEHAREEERRKARASDPAPLLGDLYGLEELRADRERRLLSLADLPGWRPRLRDPEAGHGWGEQEGSYGWGAAFDDAAGGGVCPGWSMAMGAASAGAGKTTWLMQLADGLALRAAHVATGRMDGPLTPVVILSEMGVGHLTWGSLARWCGRDARDFRRGAGGHPDAWREAETATAGPWGESRKYTRLWRASSLRGPALVKALAERTAAWRRELEDAHKCDVWPVVVVDPVQRWAGDGDDVQGVNVLAEELLAACHRGGWIMLATSDATKASATGSGEQKVGSAEWAASVFRGSYKLIHAVDLAAALHRPGEDGAMVAAFAKCRDAALPRPGSVAWDAPWNPGNGYSGRFVPRDPADEAREHAMRQRAELKGPRGSGRKRQ